MSPVLLRPRMDPDPEIQPSPSKTSISSRNGAIPAWAFFPPFPAGSGAAPARTDGAGISEAPHPEFGGLSPALGCSPCADVPSLSRCHPKPTAAPGTEPPTSTPGSGGVGASLEPSPGWDSLPDPPQTSVSHPAPPTTPGLGTRSGHPGDPAVLVPGRVAAGTALSPTPGPRGTHRQLRARLQLLPQVETKAAGAVPCRRCPQTGWCHQDLMRARGRWARGLLTHTPSINPCPAASGGAGLPPAAPPGTPSLENRDNPGIIPGFCIPGVGTAPRRR